MLATNPRSPWECTKGLRAFFLDACAPLRGHGGCQLQLHHLASQQAQGPVVMPCRRRAAGQGDQMVPVGLGTVLQNPGQPFLGKALLDPHCAQGHIFSHLGSRPTVVALEENPGPGGDSGRVFPNPSDAEVVPPPAAQRTCHQLPPPPTTLPTKQDSPIVRFLS